MDSGKKRIYRREVKKYAFQASCFAGIAVICTAGLHWNNHGKSRLCRCVTRQMHRVEIPCKNIIKVQLQNLVLEAINKVLENRDDAVLEINISM